MLKYHRVWSSSINKGYNPNLLNKLKVYAYFKTPFKLEKVTKSRNFTKLHINSYHLAIEKGRYTRQVTPKEQRSCNNYTEKTIGDERHFLLTCPKFASERRNLFYELGQSYGLSYGDLFTFNYQWIMATMTHIWLVKFWNMSMNASVHKIVNPGLRPSM